MRTGCVAGLGGVRFGASFVLGRSTCVAGASKYSTLRRPSILCRGVKVLFDGASPYCCSVLFALFFQALSFFSNPLSGLSLFFLGDGHRSVSLSYLGAVCLLLANVSASLIGGGGSCCAFVCGCGAVLLCSGCVRCWPRDWLVVRGLFVDLA